MHKRGMALRVLFVLALVSGSRLWSGELDLTAPLPVDPNIKMGQLPNGMKYWVRAHKTPPGKVGIWMHISSGSINEADNQRGLAHYLEHLAFNGSENFPAGTLVKYFESIGLRFGQHQNAFTSFDQTTYILSLPNTKPETLGKGLQCLADMGFRMSLLPEEIEKERGVILEEMRSRKGAQQRIIDKLLPLLAPGSRLADRMPIGKEEIIKTADKQRFVEYYTKWYRPDNATLLVVGDVESVEGVEKLISENFGGWKTVANPAPDEDPGIKPYTATRAAVITDPELTETDVSTACITPLRKIQTIGDYRARMIDNFASWIVNRRYSEMVEKGQAPFQNASVSVSPFLNVSTYISGSATGKPDQWEPMLLALLTEIKRAREFGFNEQELEDAKKTTIAGAEQSARTEATRDMSSFLQSMNSSVAEGRKPMSEAQRLELLKALVPGIKLSEVHEAFKKNFGDDKRLLLITMPEKAGLKVPTEKEILDVAAKAEAVKVEPVAKKERPKSLLEKDPEPAKVVKKEEEPDLKVVSATLENGVNVHVRSMDFKKDQVFCSITVGGGKIRENASNRGLSDAAALALGQIATRKLSSTTIREMMTGLNVSVGGGAADDAFSISVSGSAKDLEEGLRLAHLLFKEGKIEESALKLWKETTLQELESRKTSVEMQLMERANDLISNNDPRLKPVNAEQVNKVTLEAAQSWLESVLNDGPIEAAIVGDIEADKALALAQKYLGSLSSRDKKDSELVKLRKMKNAKGPFEETVQVETITPRAVVLSGWRGADWKDVKDRRVLQIASQILSARLREEIREKRSLTYSISCHASPARVYEGTGMFSAFFTADPDKAAEAMKIAREVMEKFAIEGPTDEEMETVRKQFKNQLETTLKEPSYWVGVLGDLNYRGTKLQDVKEVQEKMLSYTKEDVKSVLKKYVKEEHRMQVIALPKKKDAK
ncbi:MAG TPA: insulinase family protein [Planctomycetota bacterium]|nr:insulinase family protein [Planctomycetota bacterium]